MKHNGTCPVCEEEVPHLHYYCSRKCAKKYARIAKRLGLDPAPSRTGKRKIETMQRLRRKNEN